MNVLVTFESASLNYGLSKFDDLNAVKVTITLVLQWLLNATHRKLTPEHVLDNIAQVISDTYVYAEYMLGDNNLIESKTGAVFRLNHPTVYVEEKDPFREYSSAHGNLYLRFGEIVEHLVTNYTRSVMGFLQVLEGDKHANSISCLEFTDRYIAALIYCQNLIEYNHEPDHPQ